MYFKLFGIIAIILIGAFLFPFQTFAATQFSSNYSVIYDVDTTGDTLVTEKVVFKNLTDRYFASSFTLSIGATNISELKAFDDSGPLEVKLEKPTTPTNTQGSGESLLNKSRITVKFAKQIIGKGNEYKWTLQFRSKDFVQNEGYVRQIAIPKIVAFEDIEKYDLTLSIPTSFGDPTKILPEPISQIESGGKIHFLFDKDQLINQGIFSTFGVNQFFDYTLKYSLRNDKILPDIQKIVLPKDTKQQAITITSITPEPEDVLIDENGNYIGYFKVDKLSKTDVVVQGRAKLFNRANEVNINTLTQEGLTNLTKATTYWEKDNPIIKQRVKDLLESKGNISTLEKARLINNYVVATLKFDPARVNGQRLGAVTALANPNQSQASEFTDLFIALARSANIPSRAVVGYGYSDNFSLRPLSFIKDTLHIWPEFFDHSLGWVMIDPTWQYTSNGSDYFSNFDLSHIVFGHISTDDYDFSFPTEVKVGFSNDDFKQVYQATPTIESPDVLLSGFPADLTLQLKNTGNALLFLPDITLSASKIKISEKNNEVAKNTIHKPSLQIPPFGKVTFKFKLTADSFLTSAQDQIELRFNSNVVTKKIAISPFFAVKFLPLVIVGGLLVMVLSYILVTLAFLRRSKKERKEFFKLDFISKPGDSKTQRLRARLTSSAKNIQETFKKKRKFKKSK